MHNKRKVFCVYKRSRAENDLWWRLPVYTFNDGEVKQYWYKIEDILEGKVNIYGFYKF